MIGDAPLRSYFPSTEESCEDLAKYKEIAEDVLKILNGNRRLFITQNCLLGLGPHLVIPGDRIAVIGACDMPLVLRPKGENYEVIGSCFVQDFMDGEAGRGIDSGRFVAETITLC